MMEVDDCCPRQCHDVLKEVCSAALQRDVHIGALQIAWHWAFFREADCRSHHWVLMRLVIRSTAPCFDRVWVLLLLVRKPTSTKYTGFFIVF